MADGMSRSVQAYFPQLSPEQIKKINDRVAEHYISCMVKGIGRSGVDWSKLSGLELEKIFKQLTIECSKKARREAFEGITRGFLLQESP